MNRLKYIITSLCLALLSLAAQAAVKVGDIWYELNNPLAYEATVISSLESSNYSGDINIPSTIEYDGISYSVTSIGGHAFSDCSGLTSVTIPNSVTSIGWDAFVLCSSLTSVTIPNSVTSIGSNAFWGCSSLTSVIIPNSVTSIGDNTFRECRSLTSVTIPSSVTSIGDWAFTDCSGLKKLAYPNTLDNIFLHNGINMSYDPQMAIVEDGFVFGPEKSSILFAPCSLKDEYTIPNSVTSIGKGAFSYCSRLTSVIIPNSVTSIGNNAFAGCTGLKKSAYPNTLTNPFSNGIAVAYDPQETIMEDGVMYGPEKSSILFVPHTYTGKYIIPNSVTSVGVSAFARCENLSSIEIGNSIKAIADNAFAECGLSKVVLPPTVESIGNSAFAGNAYLTEVAIGSNVKSISDKAFDSTPLQRVYITAPEPPAAPYSAFSKYTAKLYVQGDDAVDTYYDATSCWDRFDGYAMSEPTRINIEMPERLPRNAGDTFTLKASLTPDNVDLPYVFWHSTNPEIAYVDNYGNVTVRQDIPRTGDVKIIAETLYHNGPAAYFSFNSVTTDTDEVLTDTADEAAPVDVYNLQGVQVLRGAEADAINALSPGIYIVRQGGRTSKIAVK